MNPLGSAGTAHDGFVNRRVGSSSLPVGSGENRSKLAGPRTEPDRRTTFAYSFLGARRARWWRSTRNAWTRDDRTLSAADGSAFKSNRRSWSSRSQ